MNEIERFAMIFRDKHMLSKFKKVILNLGFKMQVKSRLQSNFHVILALPDGCKVCPKCKGWWCACLYCDSTGSVKWTKFIDV